MKKKVIIVCSVILVLAAAAAGVLVWFHSPGIHKLGKFYHVKMSGKCLIAESTGDGGYDMDNQIEAEYRINATVIDKFRRSDDADVKGEFIIDGLYGKYDSRGYSGYVDGDQLVIVHKYSDSSIPPFNFEGTDNDNMNLAEYISNNRVEYYAFINMGKGAVMETGIAFDKEKSYLIFFN